MTRKEMHLAGVALAERFCTANGIAMPKVTVLTSDHPDMLMRRYYHLQTCAFYRASLGICVAVVKCAHYGYGGRAWSWPGYAVDRTPYGVLQHELGHHVDEVKTFIDQRKDWQVSDLFSFKIWSQSKEKPLTGYLGTDMEDHTYYKEWFAENFRLFVTNPDLCQKLRPKFFAALYQQGVLPVASGDWESTLKLHDANTRIVEMARKKIAEANPVKIKPVKVEESSLL